MPRRKRYRVRTADGNEFDYLAFSETQIKEVCQNVWGPGYVYFTYGEMAPKWELDTFELQRAIAWLGLVWPTTVRRTVARGRNGRHSLMGHRFSRVPTHSITVNKLLDFKFANVVLWHELAHAMQAERAICGPDKFTPYKNASQIVNAWGKDEFRSRDIPYDERPTEIEARTYEYAADHWSLTKET